MGVEFIFGFEFGPSVEEELNSLGGGEVFDFILGFGDSGGGNEGELNDFEGDFPCEGDLRE